MSNGVFGRGPLDGRGPAQSLERTWPSGEKAGLVVELAEGNVVLSELRKEITAPRVRVQTSPPSILLASSSALSPGPNQTGQRACSQPERISDALAHQGNTDSVAECTLEVSLPVQARRSSEPRVMAGRPLGSVSRVQRARCLSAELLALGKGPCLQ